MKVVGSGVVEEKEEEIMKGSPNDGTGNTSEMCRWSPGPVKHS